MSISSPKLFFRICRREGAHPDPYAEHSVLANLDRRAMAYGGGAAESPAYAPSKLPIIGSR